MIAVAQLGFRTCRGSASCGGFCFAHFSFSVTQASCGQGQGAHRTRSQRSGARSGRGCSHAQRACCEVAIFCWRPMWPFENARGVGGNVGGGGVGGGGIGGGGEGLGGAVRHAPRVRPW
eukprot:scaffold130632_cov60-Phaeocystis_antarctica.AAC.1